MVRILVFGPLAERLGWRQMEREVSPTSTIEEILSDLRLTAEECSTTTPMVDGKRCEISELIGESSELALLPPVSGG